MRRMATSLLLGMFMGLMVYVSAGRLNEWYETGRLATHRTMPVGPDFVTYTSDRVGFLVEVNLNVFLIVMGGLGVLAACREIIIEIAGPQSRLLTLAGWHYANQTVSLVVGLGTLLFLVVFSVGMLHKFVS
jgi:hypothetical protein